MIKTLIKVPLVSPLVFSGVTFSQTERADSSVPVLSFKNSGVYIPSTNYSLRFITSSFVPVFRKQIKRDITCM